jgi:hypothetical protein
MLVRQKEKAAAQTPPGSTSHGKACMCTVGSQTAKLPISCLLDLKMAELHTGISRAAT